MGYVRKSSRPLLDLLNRCMLDMKKVRQSAENAEAMILRDNYHLIHRIYASVYMSLANNKTLPVCDGQKYPRVYEYCYHFLGDCGCEISDDMFSDFTDGISRTIQLQNDEISLFIDMLRIALLVRIDGYLKRPNTKKKILAALSSVRFLNNYVFEDIYKALSCNEQLLCEDDVYRRLDKESKDLYRHKIAQLALKSGKSEYDVVLDILRLAKRGTNERERHIGYYLFQKKKCYYMPVTVILPILACIVLFICSRNIWLSIISFLPAWQILKHVIDFVYSKFVKPEILPRIKIENICPKTLLTVITLISNEKDVDELIEKLERYHFGNEASGILVGILADLPQSIDNLTEQDVALVQYVKKQISALNDRFPDTFFAAVRKRTIGPDAVYTGRERKRGAVCDFLSAVTSGNRDEFLLLAGNVAGAKYFVALDSDTDPNADTIKKLVGILEHPLAQPVYNEDCTCVIDGYGIAAPRMEINLQSANKNLFSRIISGMGGVEVYGNSSFSIYQDLYGDGIFAGKGAINIEAFEKVIQGKFPDNRILSHDILEGSFLRTAYASDICFTDGTPKSLLSYMTRGHRWVRGDVQNIPYLWKNIKTEKGTIKNPLSGLSKYKIFDNLRRAITPISVLRLYLTAVFWGAWPVIIALSTSFIGFLMSIIYKFVDMSFLSTVRYRSKTFPVITQAFLQSALDFICLPYMSIVQADAVVRALYRLIKGQRMLEWTTAAESDKKMKGTFWTYLIKMWPQFFGFLFVFAPFYLWIGGVWLVAIPCAFYMDKVKTIRRFPKKDVAPMLKDMWRYFEDHLTQENHYLPPDNFQQQPLGVVAHRTSPTNIGIAMLSCLGAYDEGFIDKEKLYFYLEHALDTIEKLEKWNGHLLNWYDTTTLHPLEPKYVSSVDNGNYVAFLYTLRNGLSQYADRRAGDICLRLDRILQTTDFYYLYDEKKNLLYIGYDVERGIFSNSYYDLYASEARLTGYYAVATRQVPLKHWQCINRFMIKSQGYVGVKSWSGTMFEYFMPNILLPAQKGSFSHEMLKFAASEQIKAAGKRPWGISESAYYSFDKSLNYQYKAFGVRTLGLKNTSYAHDVISPYATWLALPFFPREAYANLMRMKNAGFYGKYGFYEAIDYSLAQSDKHPNIVYSYMAHHIGMSFLSGVNYDMNNIMQKRFMSPQMKAFSSLIEEKLPSSVVRYTDDFVQKSHKERYNIRSEEHSVISPEVPNVKFLSNGSMTSFFTDSGCGAIKQKEIYATRFMPNDTNVGFFAVYGENSMRFPLTFAPYFRTDIQYHTSFEAGEINYLSRCRDLEGRMSVCVNADVDCEVREIALKNNLGRARHGTLLVYTEPILNRLQAYRAHPAFSGLFIETKKVNGTILYHRRKRVDSEESIWVGIYTSSPCEFELSRFQAQSRFEDVPLEYAFQAAFTNRTEGAIDPCCAMKIPVSVAARDVEFVYVYTACGGTESEVLRNINYCLEKKYAQIHAGYLNKLKSIYRHMALNREDLYLHDILADAIYKKQDRYVPRRYKNRHGIEELWKFGISGDYPLIFIKVDNEAVEKITMFLKAFGLLKFAYADCELIIGYEEKSGYDRPVGTRMKELISEYGLSSLLEKRGGIFLINIRKFGDLAMFTSLSNFYADLERGWSVDSTHVRRYFRKRIFSGEPKQIDYVFKTGVGGFVKDGFGIDDKRNFPTMPPWTHIMANNRFGTVVSDSSLGYTYAYNAQKNKLTPWKNDVIADNRGEHLVMRIGARTYDLLSGASVIYKKGRAEYHTTIGNINIHVTVFVPLYDCAKVIRVNYANKGQSETVFAFMPEIVMGTGFGPSDIQKTLRNRTLYYTNTMNAEYRNGVCFVSGAGCDMDMRGAYKLVRAGESGMVYFVLGYGASEKRASMLAQKYMDSAYCKKQMDRVITHYQKFIPVMIDTGNAEFDLFYNQFLSYQVIIDRIVSRTGFYQCSGAYGFRDQLQDSIGIVSFMPQYLKHQIVRCCAHQFEEGDVMHWWHQGMDYKNIYQGVRTRFSDDLMWLPFAVCEYLDKTGDMDLLKKNVHYVTGPQLDANEQERMIDGAQSTLCEDVYQHCIRALKRALRKGRHGLILFGCGDWNDGMSAVGSLGKGETVWGSFFAVIVLERFVKLAEKISDAETAGWCREESISLRSAIEDFAWDGKWYLRGYFDNGHKLGSSENTECRIDLIPQSFAAIAGGFDEERVRAGLAGADMYLVDGVTESVNLFYPPFAESSDNPGYINGYIKGVRENGGQYTHAAVWYAMGLLHAGLYDRCFEILNMLNPVNHTKKLADVRRYRVEPYVLSGDVYANPSHRGMGGWSHYTGSAGWYFKTITEDLLGIVRRGGMLYIEPHLPGAIQNYKATIRIDGTQIHLEVKPGPEQKLYIDGLEAQSIPIDDKVHTVVYEYKRQ